MSESKSNLARGVGIGPLVGHTLGIVGMLVLYALPAALGISFFTELPTAITFVGGVALMASMGVLGMNSLLAKAEGRPHVQLAVVSWVVACVVAFLDMTGITQLALKNHGQALVEARIHARGNASEVERLERRLARLAEDRRRYEDKAEALNRDGTKSTDEESANQRILRDKARAEEIELEGKIDALVAENRQNVDEEATSRAKSHWMALKLAEASIDTGAGGIVTNICVFVFCLLLEWPMKIGLTELFMTWRRRWCQPGTRLQQAVDVILSEDPNGLRIRKATPPAPVSVTISPAPAVKKKVASSGLGRLLQRR